jgi:hypothetical protein
VTWDTSKNWNLGEIWLRSKLRNHGQDAVRRADSGLLYAAIQDVLRELDRCRDGE